MSDHNDSSVGTSLLAAFAVGALVGAGLALLYAPRSGSETREMVSKKAGELKGMANSALEHGKSMVGDLKGRASEALERGKDAARQAANDVSNAANRNG